MGVEIEITGLPRFTVATHGDGVNDSGFFQATINRAAAVGGGVVVVRRRQQPYSVVDVEIPGGVYVQTEAGTTFQIAGSTGARACFFITAGFNTAAWAENCGFIGGPTIFDFTPVSGGPFLSKAIDVRNARNWVVENIVGVGLVSGNTVQVSNSGSGYVPTNGLIRNVRFTDAGNDDYGAVQVTAASGLRIDNIWHDDGIGVRLETDGQNADVEDVYVTHIVCDGGYAPFSLTAHDYSIRRVRIKGFTSLNPTAGSTFWNDNGAGGYLEDITIQDGYIEGGTMGLFEIDAPLPNTPRGQFKVENVRVVGCASSRGAIQTLGGTYVGCIAEGNTAGTGFEHPQASGNSQKSLTLIDCTAKNNSSVGFKHEAGFGHITHIGCEAFDDRPLQNLSGEKLTTNQQGVETNTTGLTAYTNCTIARSTAVKRTGSASLELTSSAAGEYIASTLTGTSGFSVTPATVYTGQAYILGPGGSVGRVALEWYTSGGAFISRATDGFLALSPAGWVHSYVAAAAPANAAFGTLLVVVFQAAGAGELTYLDDMTVKSGGSAMVQPYGLQATDPVLAIGGSYSMNSVGRINGSAASIREVAPTDFAPASGDGQLVTGSASAGSATLPANPVGFLSVKVGGVDRKIPYYGS